MEAVHSDIKTQNLPSIEMLLSQAYTIIQHSFKKAAPLSPPPDAHEFDLSCDCSTALALLLEAECDRQYSAGETNTKPTACLLHDGMVGDVWRNALHSVGALQHLRHCAHATCLCQRVAFAGKVIRIAENQRRHSCSGVAKVTGCTGIGKPYCHVAQQAHARQGWRQSGSALKNVHEEKRVNH
jgi:hypothetical protein